MQEALDELIGSMLQQQRTQETTRLLWGRPQQIHRRRETLPQGGSHIVKGGPELEEGGMLATISMEAAELWFTVTAVPGMWGQRASLLPLIFICSTVCFAFKSLAEHEALDTPWMAQEPVHILKTRDPFSKLGGSGTQRDDIWRGCVCAE